MKSIMVRAGVRIAAILLLAVATQAFGDVNQYAQFGEGSVSVEQYSRTQTAAGTSATATLRVKTVPPKVLTDAVAAGVSGKPVRLTFDIVTYTDETASVPSARDTLTDAWITAVHFGQMDAADNMSPAFTVDITSTSVAARDPGAKAAPVAKGERMLASRFALDVADIDEASDSHIARVSTIDVIIPPPAGSNTLAVARPPVPSHAAMTIADSYLAPFQAWVSAPARRVVILRFLNGNYTIELCRLTLNGALPVSITTDSSSTSLARSLVEVAPTSAAFSCPVAPK